MGRPVGEQWTTVWGGSGSRGDHPVDDGPSRWRNAAPSAGLPFPLWNAVDSSGRRTFVLTRRDAALSTIHRSPYSHDLMFHHVVGDWPVVNEGESR